MVALEGRVCTNSYYIPGEPFERGDARRIVECLLLNLIKQDRAVADLKLFRTLIDRTN
jgi:hypothetical protein